MVLACRVQSVLLRRCPGNGLREQPPRSPGSPSGTRGGEEGVPGGRKVTRGPGHIDRSLCCLGLCGPETMWDDPWLPNPPPGWCLEERPRARTGAGSPDLSGARARSGPRPRLCSLWPWVVILAGSVARVLWNTPEHSRILWNTPEHAGTLRTLWTWSHMPVTLTDAVHCLPPPCAPRRGPYAILTSVHPAPPPVPLPPRGGNGRRGVSQRSAAPGALGSTGVYLNETSLL